MKFQNAELMEQYALRTAQHAAIAAFDWIGKGNEKAADLAAVSAMRLRLNSFNISGKVVIGEGERDEAPMLFIGETLGLGGEELDIAVDPLEGTTLCANGSSNSLAVIALAPKGTLLHSPDVYMEKIAVGCGLPAGIISFSNTIEQNIKNVAEAKNCRPENLSICILNRPRHAEIISKARSIGAKVILISDGDISAVISTSCKHSGIDMYIGTGGAPEGVLAAASLSTIGGQMQGKLIFKDDVEIQKAKNAGIVDTQRIYNIQDMVQGEVILAACGITDGSMVNGVKYLECGSINTNTIIFNSATKQSKIVNTKHLAF